MDLPSSLAPEGTALAVAVIVAYSVLGVMTGALVHYLWRTSASKRPDNQGELDFALIIRCFDADGQRIGTPDQRVRLGEQVELPPGTVTIGLLNEGSLDVTVRQVEGPDVVI